MDRLLELISFIVSVPSLIEYFLSVDYAEYYVFYIVPIVIFGIVIVTTVIRLLVRQVHY